MRILGIDPGFRNLGLAWVVEGERPHTLYFKVEGPDDALERIIAVLGSPVIPTVIAVEGFGGFWPPEGGV